MSDRSWSAHIFGEESRKLRKCTFRLRLLLVLVGAMSVAGFCVTQFWLFKEIAVRDLHLINSNGILRTWTVTVGFLLRSQMLAAARNDTATFNRLASDIARLGDEFKDEFGASYVTAHQHGVREFYLHERYNVSVPFPTGWRTDIMNFWKLGNEWILRVEQASTGSVTEYKNLDYSPLFLSESKTAVKFV